jgi:hypothetical protein
MLVKRSQEWLFTAPVFLRRRNRCNHCQQRPRAGFPASADADAPATGQYPIARRGQTNRYRHRRLSWNNPATLFLLAVSKFQAEGKNLFPGFGSLRNTNCFKR